ncbi:MAG: DNA starvation/stationary phase protection protein [Demequinaceae bacterium]|nr:DNA starvation/stationary phase protection protein [Demequinaceae bacterium]
MTAKNEPNLGIGAQDVTALVAGLSKLLADTYTLYTQTQGYHWNVTGPTFGQLHTMFETQYIELRDAVDEIAERIRALGKPSPGSLAEFRELASVQDKGPAQDAAEMVANLAAGHEAIARTARPLVKVAEDAVDVATADLITGRIVIHEKTAWMLRATGA